MTTTIISGCYWPQRSGSEHNRKMPSFTSTYFSPDSPPQVPRLTFNLKCKWRCSITSTVYQQTFICFWQPDSDNLQYNILPESQLFVLSPLQFITAVLGDSQQGLTTPKQSPSYPTCRVTTSIYALTGT